jgi:hypothetical protein
MLQRLSEQYAPQMSKPTNTLNFKLLLKNYFRPMILMCKTIQFTCSRFMMVIKNITMRSTVGKLAEKICQTADPRNNPLLYNTTSFISENADRICSA